MSNNHLNKRQSRSLVERVSVRQATPGDAPAIERLAQLDSARIPAEPVLIAEVAGEPRAAVSMLDGRAVADPFHRTADVVAMLRMRSGLPAEAGFLPAKALGRSLWKRGGDRDPRLPVPSAPSIPGFPTLPGHTS